MIHLQSCCIFPYAYIKHKQKDDYYLVMGYGRDMTLSDDDIRFQDKLGYRLSTCTNWRHLSMSESLGYIIDKPYPKSLLYQLEPLALFALPFYLIQIILLSIQMYEIRKSTSSQDIVLFDTLKMNSTHYVRAKLHVILTTAFSHLISVLYILSNASNSSLFELSPQNWLRLQETMAIYATCTILMFNLQHNRNGTFMIEFNQQNSRKTFDEDAKRWILFCLTCSLFEISVASPSYFILRYLTVILLVFVNISLSVPKSFILISCICLGIISFSNRTSVLFFNSNAYSLKLFMSFWPVPFHILFNMSVLPKPRKYFYTALLVIFVLALFITKYSTPLEQLNMDWCCLLYERIPQNCRISFGVTRFYSSNVNVDVFSSDALTLSTTQIICLLATLLTHVAAVPGIQVSKNKKFALGFIVGCFTIVASCLYHFCNLAKVTILGINDGNFHRLDNSFAFICFVGTLYKLLQPVASVYHIDMVTWLSVYVGLILQEVCPWNPVCTFAPIIFASFYCYIYFKYFALPKQSEWKDKSVVDRNSLNKALLTLCLGLICLVIGFDEARDMYRLW